jgi:hypothetical protein
MRQKRRQQSTRRVQSAPLIDHNTTRANTASICGLDGIDPHGCADGRTSVRLRTPPHPTDPPSIGPDDVDSEKCSSGQARQRYSWCFKSPHYHLTGQLLSADIFAPGVPFKLDGCYPLSTFNRRMGWASLQFQVEQYGMVLKHSVRMC